MRIVAAEEVKNEATPLVGLGYTINHEENDFRVYRPHILKEVQLLNKGRTFEDVEDIFEITLEPSLDNTFFQEMLSRSTGNHCIIFNSKEIKKAIDKLQAVYEIVKERERSSD